MKEGRPMGTSKMLALLLLLFTIHITFAAGAVEGTLKPRWGQLQGKLMWITASDSGAVWGVNSNQDIYRYDNGVWTYIRGKLVQISAGAAGVWGVNANDDIYRWNPAINNWDLIRGKLVRVASGSQVWGVNRANQIYRLNANNNWDLIPGTLAEISVSDSGRVVGVSPYPDGVPYEYKNSEWKKMTGVNITPQLVRITVGAFGVWGIRSPNTVYNYYGKDGYWGFVSASGELVQMDSGYFAGANGGKGGEVLMGVNIWGDIFFTDYFTT